MNEKRSTDGNENTRKNILEWAVFTVSIVLVLTVLSYLGYKTYTHQTSPADIVVTYQASPTPSMPYRYHLTVNNVGGETAENLIIAFELQRNQTILEKAEIELIYVPKASKREGWINFSINPADADSVTAHVVSFKTPS